MDLGLQLQTHTDLVAAGIEVLAIDQRGQGQGDSVAQLLLVAQTHLAGVVHLSAHAGIIIQLILGADGELGVAGAAGPRQLYTHIQLVRSALEDRAAELLAIVAKHRTRQSLVCIDFICHAWQLQYLHSCVQNKVLGGVAKGKVVGGQLGLLCVKCGLVAGQPSLVAKHGRGIDQGALQINVHIRIGLDVLMAVGNLELAVLVSDDF